MQVASVGVPKYPEATVKRNPRLGLLLVLAAGVPFWATVVWLVLR